MRRRRRALAHAVQGEALEQTAEGFVLQTDQGVHRSASVVIATGGLSIPKIGATDFGYRIAKQFGLRMVEPRPALVPLTFDAEAGRRSSKWPASRWKWMWKLARSKAATRPARASVKTCCSPTVACPARRSCNFVVLAAGHANHHQSAAGTGSGDTLIEGKGTIKKQLGNVLSQWLPARLAEGLLLPTVLRWTPVWPTCRTPSCASWAPPSTSGR
jgi:hypothetical protein